MRSNSDLDTLPFGRGISLGLLIARIFVGLAFMSIALGQIKYYGHFKEAAFSIGLPFVGFYSGASIAFNFLGAVSFILGFYVRIGAVLLLLVVLPALFSLIFSPVNSLTLAAVLQ